VSVAGLRPGFGLGGITHSLLVRDNVAVAEVGGGDDAGAVWAGFMIREGRRMMFGLTSTDVAGDAAAAGEVGSAAMMAGVAAVVSIYRGN
jgi:hypothetical protein